MKISQHDSIGRMTAILAHLFSRLGIDLPLRRPRPRDLATSSLCSLQGELGRGRKGGGGEVECVRVLDLMLGVLRS